MICLDRVLRLPALRLAVAAFLIAPGAAALAADCAQWNVAGKHTLLQSNMANSLGSTPMDMTLQQDGTLFKGSISFTYRNGDVDAFLVRTGDIVGTVAGNKFEATVYWDDSKLGVYSGQIGPQGLVVGRTFNKNSPAESADFHGTPAFDCLTASAPGGAGNNANNGNSAQPAMALGRVKLQPTIVEPQKGGGYAPQAPLRIRIVAAKGVKDTAYRIEIQRQRISGSSSAWNLEWLDVIALDTPAEVAQSPQGYRGWGGAQAASGRAAMAATGGLYRVRARAMAPQAGQPGDWVEFKINGPRGRDDAANEANTGPQGAGVGAARSAASRMLGQPSTPNTLANAPALNAQTLAPKTLAGAAALNAQTLAPKSPAALAAKPLSGAGKNTDAVMLNPQPLPPGGLQQAPSSLR